MLVIIFLPEGVLGYLHAKFRQLEGAILPGDK
jgi:hypothetical protein